MSWWWEEPAWFCPWMTRSPPSADLHPEEQKDLGWTWRRPAPVSASSCSSSSSFLHSSLWWKIITSLPHSASFMLLHVCPKSRHFSIFLGFSHTHIWWWWAGERSWGWGCVGFPGGFWSEAWSTDAVLPSVFVRNLHLFGFNKCLEILV